MSFTRDEHKRAKQSGRKVASDETMIRLPLNREIYNQAKAVAILKNVPMKQYVNEALELMMKTDAENGVVKIIADSGHLPSPSQRTAR